MLSDYLLLFFFFHDTATTEIYTLSLHDALPICQWKALEHIDRVREKLGIASLEPARLATSLSGGELTRVRLAARSEEHTSELQSRRDLVCRLLLEKKKKNKHNTKHSCLLNHHLI